MILIPEQIKALREECRRLEDRKNNYKDYFDDRKVVAADETFASVVGDGITESQYQSDIKTLKENEELLENSKYLKNRDTDKISIGTKFIVKFDDDDEEEELMLVEAVTGATTMNGFTSSQSIMGKTILGKTKGEKFSYNITRKDRTTSQISGEIKDIITDYDSYDHFIRERDIRNRKTREYKELSKEIYSSLDKDAIANLEGMTASQKELLILEANNLVKHGLGTEYDIHRLAHIKNLLTSKKVLRPDESSDTIQVGSSFSYITFDKQKTTTKRSEMINKAYSDELEQEYVERLSPLGSKVYGLHNNEEFYISDGKGNGYSGIVFDIDNKKNGLKTNDALVYQKNKR